MEGTVKVLITCNGGMSSTMIATRANRRAKKENLDIVFDSMPLRRAQLALDNFDVVLLSPSIGTFASEFRHYAREAAIEVVPMRDYGRFDVASMTRLALSLMPEIRRKKALRESLGSLSDEALPTNVVGAREADLVVGENERNERKAKDAQKTVESTQVLKTKLLVISKRCVSTSKLVERLAQELKSRGLDLEVVSRAKAPLSEEVQSTACILVAPQEKAAYQALCDDRSLEVPVVCIDKSSFDAQDASAIINQALIRIAEQRLHQ